MYCPSCGVAVTGGLSYCNYCGAKLSAAKDDGVVKTREIKPELVVSAMVVVFVFGLAAITMLIGMMKSVLALNVGQILAFAMLSFLIMLFLEGVFVRLLFRRNRAAKEAGDTEPLERHTTKELDAARARSLPEPVPSVTENTTRTFEPIYTEQRKNS
jgi:putative copper export protein